MLAADRIPRVSYAAATASMFSLRTAKFCRSIASIALARACSALTISSADALPDDAMLSYAAFMVAFCVSMLAADRIPRVSYAAATASMFSLRTAKFCRSIASIALARACSARMISSMEDLPAEAISL